MISRIITVSRIIMISRLILISRIIIIDTKKRKGKDSCICMAQLDVRQYHVIVA